jgi:dTDP-4-dehydrorhamnose reductase
MRPEAVIHSAALSAMAECACDPERARAINVDAAANVARAAAEVGARVVHVSTDLVFGGEEAPYDESSKAAPTSVYGRTKRAAEEAVLAFAGTIVVRVSLLFGPRLTDSHEVVPRDTPSRGRTERKGFFDQQLETLRSGKPLTLFDDEWRTPLSLRSAAESLVAIARSDDEGLLHLGGPERMSRYDMGMRLASVLGCSFSEMTRASRTSIGGEPRPRDVALDSGRFLRRFPALASGSFETECLRMLGEIA